MLVSGAGIVSANADTTNPQVGFINTCEVGCGQTSLSFSQFNQPGTLTGVTFNLQSIISFEALISVSAAVSVNGSPIFSIFAPGPLPVPFNGGPLTLGSDPSFIGAGTFFAG